jgi:hypothetical protein
VESPTVGIDERGMVGMEAPATGEGEEGMAQKGDMKVGAEARLSAARGQDREEG